MSIEDRFELIESMRWFDDHVVAEFTPSTLLWKRPDSSFYAVRYTIQSGRLIVVGDMGDAIYQWSQLLTWDFLKNLDFSYFHGKCTASEAGRPFNEWNEAAAKRYLLEIFADRGEGLSAEQLETCLSHIYSQGAWVAFLGNEGWDIFGSEYHDYGEIGVQPALRCAGHWRGLQLALQKAMTEVAHA